MKVALDLHTHSRFSADSVAEPEIMIREARVAGLHGFAITDHDSSEAVPYFLENGWMREDGEPVDDFLIIPGQEISTAEGHLLALGVRLPRLKGIPAAEAVDRIHAEGGIAVPAHPYDRFRAGIREPFLKTLPVDAIETFNAASTLPHYNRRAARFAEAQGIPGIAGSDAHHEDAIGISHTIFDVDRLCVSAVLAAVQHGAVTPVERRLTLRKALKKTFHNAFRTKPGKT